MAVAREPILVGQDQIVPLVTGDARPYINLDYAASAPALRAVREALDVLLPWYSSVHRGAGFKSQVCTAAYEAAREAMRSFCHARTDDAVIFTRNTTDALNLLAWALPADTKVFTFALEHHANLLAWTRAGREIQYLPFPASPDRALAAIEEALRSSQAGTRLVAVTGVSNVTGEVWPLHRITELCHSYGARVAVDAAQLAPHFPIDLVSIDADYIAFSGHKLYAPFGAGVLVGRADWLREAPPFLFGGGAVDFVTLSSVTWTSLPDRQEAGSPNVLGAYAMGVACDVLGRRGMQHIADDEIVLATYARDVLSEVQGIQIYQLWPGMDVPRLGIVTFNLDGMPHSQLAAVLSAEYGIGVRHGCFCAHPYLQWLLQCDIAGAERVRHDIVSGHRENVPGAVRMSLGLGSSRDDIDALAAALQEVSRDGPRWSYRLDEPSGEYQPEPDPRLFPPLPLRPARYGHRGGEAS